MKKTSKRDRLKKSCPKLDLKMKITFLFLIFAFLQLKANIGYGQLEKINLDLNEVTLREAFLEIEGKTKFRFFYKNQDLNLNRQVTLKARNKTIDTVVAELLQGEEVNFEVVDKQVVIKKKLKVGDLKTEQVEKVNLIQSQINGTVSDGQGIPLAGASIVEKGTSNGTQSDFDGNFTLEVGQGATLVVSYIGFITQEVTVSDEQSIEIKLLENTAALDEVVVVGYGTKRKRDIVSAVSVVDLEEVKDVPATDVSRLLLGQAPGVNVSQNSGRPGRELDIVVRGLGSLGASSSPLYVVDGFPLGTSTGLSLNPSEIESISVLKDAASTAIYGARGSNGVILITTKGAKASKNGVTSVTLDITTGIQSVPHERRFEMMNAVEFGQFQKESYIDRFIANNSREPSESEIPIGIRNPENNTISTDWFDEILNNTPLFKKYNLTTSFGNEKTKALISLGYMNQDGVVLNTNFERFNARANINSKITDNITIGLNMSGSRSRERYIADGSRNLAVGIALWADPREPVYNDDGSFNDYLGGNGTPGDFVFGSVNPVQLLHEEKNTRIIDRVISNLYAEFKFLKDFTFKSSLNGFVTNIGTHEFRPSTLATNGFNSPPPRDAILREGYLKEFNWSADQLLTYSKIINDDHNLDVLLGYTSQESTYRSILTTGTTFPDDDVRFLQNAESITIETQDSGGNPGTRETSWSLLAYFARFSYDYKYKYLLSATYRREGSSRFGSNNRWGDFPAVSLGWRVSEETPFQNLSWLNDLKLRASFGITGNNNIGNYTSLSTLRAENYILNGNFVPGKVLSSLSNTDLGWEESKQFNYGLDLTLFDNRLTFVGEYYKKTTENMLLPVNIPTISGFETTFTNIGKVQNTGFEFGLNFQTSISDALKIRSNFNISFNNNKVLEIDGNNDEIRTGGDYYGANNISKVGQPIGILYGFRNLGVFTSVEEINSSPTQDGAIPGSFKYFDANGDGEISYDTEDWVEIGNPNPDFIWSLNTGVDYKAFDLNVVLTGAENYDIYRNIESTTMNLDGVFNVEKRAKNRFRYTTMSGDGVIPTSNYPFWERESNTFYVYDASHIWLRSVSLGYTIPLNPESFIQSARLYINGDNLYLFTDYPGGNPQVNTSGGISPGVDNQPYPLPQTITFGGTFKF